MDNTTLLRTIKRQLKAKISVDRVILFGSRARGVFYTDSDYDIAVVSKDFEHMPFCERDRITRAVIRKVLGYKPLDIACYTPEEYDSGKVGFLPETIEAEGIEA